MKKVTATVTESVILQKSVCFYVPDYFDADEHEADIMDKISEKVYEKTIFGFVDEHGWEGIDLIEKSVNWSFVDGQQDE